MVRWKKGGEEGFMKVIILFIVAYLIGNLLTAHFVSRLLYKGNIHDVGSGNAGARNAGRMFGKKAFIFTFLGDAAKGAAVIIAAKCFGFSLTVQLFALLGVILGHLFPVFFRFKGGKGMSTFAGGMLACQPLLFAVLLVLFIPFYLISRSLTIGALGAIASIPFVMIFFSYKPVIIFIGALISFFIILSHRHNIKEKILK